MTRNDMAQLLDQICMRLQEVRKAGQAEYAHGEENAFANFERVGAYLQTDRKKVLMTYLLKHQDGITAYLNGHKSQREDVRGRILDMMMYLALLWGMINEDEHPMVESSTTTPIASSVRSYNESLQNDTRRKLDGQ